MPVLIVQIVRSSVCLSIKGCELDTGTVYITVVSRPLKDYDYSPSLIVSSRACVSYWLKCVCSIFATPRSNT